MQDKSDSGQAVKEQPAKLDYSKTLNLPEQDTKNPDGLDTNNSSIAQRANLPKREPTILEYWRRADIYQKSLSAITSNGDFILHDGPPFSNNHIHLGTALNKILKDIVVKYKSMQGYRSPYVPGWDNHGLPIETAVSKEFREKKLTPSLLEIRKRCREYAAEWVQVQSKEFQRLGVRGDWDNPYLTMANDIEAATLDVFRQLVETGYVYRGVKPVYWCPVDQTALAEAETEYAQKTDLSIYVRFPLKEDPNHLFDGMPNPGIVIWTTTPWTIPANLALAVHPSFEYDLVGQGARVLLIAKERVAPVMEALNLTEWTVLRTVPGTALEGLIFKHPLYARDSPIVFADYVTLDEGSGVVHTAPGHGLEDFRTGQKYGLPTLSPVDNAGRFTEEAGKFLVGMSIWEGNPVVVDALRREGALLATLEIVHSYPHCWRCHNPVIFRATAQWFIDVDHNNLRGRCLEAIEHVQWFPDVSKNRIKSMIANSPDWCISRQRSWGVGIPVFYCKSCNTEVLSGETVGYVRDLVALEGSDTWFRRSAVDLLPGEYRCAQCQGCDFEKETDIFDVWFESGSTNRTVLESDKWPLLTWPADTYLEGGDQHRGWFNVSLKLAMATKGKAPYSTVITNGWTLDEQGKAMHKSAGNAVSPETIVDKDGADVLRLWVASTDYFEDVRLGAGILEQTKDMYRRIRNTLRWCLGNLYDFNPDEAVPYSAMPQIDKFVLHRLSSIVGDVTRGYETHEFHRAIHSIHQFCVVDLSAFYLDVIKDRLYADAASSRSRRSAQTVLMELTSTLTRALSPVLSFTAEEVWQKLALPQKPQSVELAAFPTARLEHIDDALASTWSRLLAIRGEVNKAIEVARQTKQIGKPLESKVVVSCNPSTIALLTSYLADLPALFLVSQVEIVAGDPSDNHFRVEPAAGAKCARCWLVKQDTDSMQQLCDRCRNIVGQQQVTA